MANKLEISLKDNYILLNYNGFMMKKKDTMSVESLLYKDYGEIKKVKKTGNDLVITYQEITIVIKSIRNIKKFSLGYIITEYLQSISSSKSLKLIKS